MVTLSESVGTTSVVDVLPWLLLGYIASTVVGLEVGLLHLTVFRDRKFLPVALWKVLLSISSYGFVFAVVVEVGSRLLGIPSLVGLPERIIAMTVFSTLFNVFFILFLDYGDRVDRLRRRLIAEFVDSHLAQLRQDELIQRLNEDIVLEVAAELAPEATKLEARLASIATQRTEGTLVDPVQWKAIATDVMSTAQNSVRPLSRRLARTITEKQSSSSTWSLFSGSARFAPFRTMPLIIIYLLGNTASAIRLFGLGPGIALLWTTCVVVVLVTVMGNVLMTRFPRFHLALFLGGTLLLETLVFCVGLGANFFVTGSQPVPILVVQALLGFACVFATSGFMALRQKGAQLRDHFQAATQAERIRILGRNRIMAEVAQEASQLLHGAVQTRLVSCAIAIRRAGEAGDLDRLNAALTEALNVIDAPLQQPISSETIEGEVMRKVALWRGLCDFTVEVTVTDFGTDGGLPKIIGRIVEEGISNAMRHGGASAMAISVVPSGAEIIVEIGDNGVGHTGGVPGGGSSYLSSRSAGNWSLESTPLGSRLRVVLSPVRV
jgi:two-component system sensor histidine kinase UhpB